jgi:hypothetical protein
MTKVSVTFNFEVDEGLLHKWRCEREKCTSTAPHMGTGGDMAAWVSDMLTYSNAMTEAPDGMIEILSSTYTEDRGPIIICINTMGTDRGVALVTCAADDRLDGRLGRTEGKYFFDLYNEQHYVLSTTRETAIRKVARRYGHKRVEFRYEKA